VIQLSLKKREVTALEYQKRECLKHMSEGIHYEGVNTASTT
jgi:hypothetical protein